MSFINIAYGVIWFVAVIFMVRINLKKNGHKPRKAISSRS